LLTRGLGNEFNIGPLLSYYAQPSLMLFLCEDQQHTLAILKTRTKFRFFDANAGIMSCANKDNFITGIHQYLRNDMMFKKYTLHGTRSTISDVQLDLELFRVYTRTGANKTDQQIEGDKAWMRSL